MLVKYEEAKTCNFTKEKGNFCFYDPDTVTEIVLHMTQIFMDARKMQRIVSNGAKTKQMRIP